TADLYLECVIRGRDKTGLRDLFLGSEDCFILSAISRCCRCKSDLACGLIYGVIGIFDQVRISGTPHRPFNDERAQGTDMILQEERPLASVQNKYLGDRAIDCLQRGSLNG